MNHEKDHKSQWCCNTSLKHEILDKHKCNYKNIIFVHIFDGTENNPGVSMSRKIGQLLDSGSGVSTLRHSQVTHPSMFPEGLLLLRPCAGDTVSNKKWLVLLPSEGKGQICMSSVCTMWLSHIKDCKHNVAYRVKLLDLKTDLSCNASWLSKIKLRIGFNSSEEVGLGWVLC